MEPTEESQYPPEEFICFQDGPTFADVAHYSDEELLFWYDGVQGEEIDSIDDLASQYGLGTGIDYRTQQLAYYDVLHRIATLTESNESVKDLEQHIAIQTGNAEAISGMNLASAALRVAEAELRNCGKCEEKDINGIEFRVNAYLAALDRFRKARAATSGKYRSKDREVACTLFDKLLSYYESKRQPIKRSKIISDIKRKLGGPHYKTIKRWLEGHRPEIE